MKRITLEQLRAFKRAVFDITQKNDIVTFDKLKEKSIPIYVLNFLISNHYVSCSEKGFYINWKSNKYFEGKYIQALQDRLSNPDTLLLDKIAEELEKLAEISDDVLVKERLNNLMMIIEDR